MLSLKKIKFESGFTLAEVMVVIAIIGIMSGIAIPNFISWLPDYRLRSATRDIVSCMQLAKLRAVKENATVSVKFNISSGQYIAWLDNGDGAGTANDDIYNGNEPTIMTNSLPAGVNFNQNKIFKFNSRGFPTSMVGVTVIINNTKSNSNSVIVNTAGNIRAQ
jgi:type IV fimbrial biogenesis protein FimT